MCYCISSKRCTCVQIHSRKCQHTQSPLPFLFSKRLPASTALVYSTAIIFYYCHTTHLTELFYYYNKVLSMHHYYSYFCEKFYSIFTVSQHILISPSLNFNFSQNFVFITYIFTYVITAIFKSLSL